jgi:hypothetical protein
VRGKRPWTDTITSTASLKQYYYGDPNEGIEAGRTGRAQEKDEKTFQAEELK